MQLRQGAALNNFDQRLPAAESALAQSVLKDPYLFDFLGLGEDAQERDIEDGLVLHPYAREASGFSPGLRARTPHAS